MTYNGHSSQYYGHISYSQHGEDLFIVDLFRQFGMEKFSYLDLGAHHPLDISSTALMYKRGCRGVNVEANPNLILEICKHRPEDVNVNRGVHIEKGEKTFYMYNDTHGMNTFSWEETGREQYSAKSSLQLPVVTIDEIVEVHCKGEYPLFLNCDIEGLDYDVLKSADFTKSHPLIVCVEVRYSDSNRFTIMMEDKGFYAHARLGENIIYVHKTRQFNLHMNMGIW